jgi:hypothetical protein
MRRPSAVLASLLAFFNLHNFSSSYSAPPQLHLDISSNISDMNGFYDRVMAKMHEWPFNCVDCGSKVDENVRIKKSLKNNMNE